jgi:DNA-binding IclR family transcriptional regulator
MDEADALALLKSSRRSAMTQHTLTDLAALRKAIAQARKLGYALNDQEAFIGDLSVAAPLLDRQGRPVGAVNVAVPTPRWHIPELLDKLVPQLVRTAAAINKELKAP